MAHPNHLIEHSEFRAVAVIPDNLTIVVSEQQHQNRLPRLVIPSNERIAPRLCHEARRQWNVWARVIDILPGDSRSLPCAVLELPAWNHLKLSPNEHLGQPSEICSLDLTSAELRSLEEIFSGHSGDRGPFSRLGWIDEAEAWVLQIGGRESENPPAEIEQHTASGFHALLRFPASQSSAFWLKAIAHPNSCEFAITRLLARICPQFVPPVIGERLDWSAWVTREIGKAFSADIDSSALSCVMASLARLQLQSLPYIESLKLVGCQDHTLPTLRRAIPDLICYLEVCMGKQNSTRVQPLTPKELRDLSGSLELAIEALRLCGLPDTLIHNDVNPGNILIDGEVALFIDWNEASIGCPWFTFHHLCALAQELFGTNHLQPFILTHYLRHWGDLIPQARTHHVLALSRPLAIASFLFGKDLDFSSPRRSSAAAEGYARALARKMAAFCRSDAFQEALCN